MRSDIDGKVYDTAKAEEICQLSSTADRGNFTWHETTLFRTQRGRFFIAGKGGPMSMWAERVDTNTRCSGSGLRPVSKDAAREYMEASGCTASEFAVIGIEVDEA